MKEEKRDRHEGEKIASVWFDESVLDRVDRLAVRGDISRSRLIRNLTVIGVEYLEAAEKFGVLQTALVLRDFGAWFKERCESGRTDETVKV
jgi:hypothetical protein